MTRSIRLKCAFIALNILFLNACSNIASRFTYEFESYPHEARIQYEPGAKDLADLVYQHLNQSLKNIESREYIPFKAPEKIRIFVFNDTGRFSNYSFTSPRARGSASENEIYLSPLLRDRLHTLPGILMHELSHIHLHQYTGDWQYVINIPGWFHEGLAVVSSDGAGAERVSSYEAIQAIKNGQLFKPESKGSIFGHKSAHDYDMKPHMYYRQASLFVSCLQQMKPQAFEKSYIQLTESSDFEDVWKKNYGKPLDELWNNFLSDLNESSFTKNTGLYNACLFDK